VHGFVHESCRLSPPETIAAWLAQIASRAQSLVPSAWCRESEGACRRRAGCRIGSAIDMRAGSGCGGFCSCLMKSTTQFGFGLSIPAMITSSGGVQRADGSRTYTQVKRHWRRQQRGQVGDAGIQDASCSPRFTVPCATRSRADMPALMSRRSRTRPHVVSQLVMIATAAPDHQHRHMHVGLPSQPQDHEL
jgi:hypothetical protein